MRSMTACLCAAALLALGTADDAAAAFAGRPVAVRADGKVKIAFAVTEPTDVAVSIEDASGNVVRHLVAGVLGDNPPPPLKAGALAQQIEWDGKADDGQAAGGGPFTVRVALGLGARFDREAIAERQNLSGSKGGVFALAVAPDGTLLLACGFGAEVPNWTGWQLVAFDRAGRYARTVLPPPAGTSPEAWKALGTETVTVDGRTSPLIVSLAGRRLFGEAVGRKTGMAVAPGGQILLLTGPRIAAVAPDGTCPWGDLTGPRLLSTPARLGLSSHAGLAVSPDGRWAYVTGLHGPAGNRQAPAFAAVYRVGLPRRAGAEPFFGEPARAGLDQAHLSHDPRGLAVDGKGHLLVADHLNDRVVVLDEKDGKFAGSFAVPRPHHVAVDPRGGAVYVTSLVGRRDVELIKFGDWRTAQPLGRLRLPPDGNPDFPWSLALDASAQPPLLWAGGDSGRLLRIVDKDGRLAAEQVSTDRTGKAAFGDLQVNRFAQDGEVYVRAGQGRWLRYAEATGEVTTVKLDLPNAAGTCIVPGPNGCLYAPAYPYHLLRFGRDGRPAPWPAGEGRYPDSVLNWRGERDQPRGPAHGAYLPVSMTYMTHTFGIRWDGRLFALDPGRPRTRPGKMLIEYDARGRRVGQPIIWKVSDTAVGPKFDPAGNVYLAEQIRPPEQPVPEEFAALIGPVRAGTRVPAGPKAAVCTSYGSIVKFPAGRGGMVHWGGSDPFEGDARLDPSLRKADALYFQADGEGGRFGSVAVTGAEWIRVGVAHVALHYCNCETTRFDVDAFGRVFYPDLCAFRVGVLDTRGNLITRFGGYGNADGAGPASSHPRPEIAFAWLIGVGVTEKYAYMGDSLSRRLLRARLTCAAEASCTVP